MRPPVPKPHRVVIEASTIGMLRLSGVKYVSDCFERWRTAEALSRLADNSPDYQGPPLVIICNNRPSETGIASSVRDR